MATPDGPVPSTPEEAWQRLAGTWTYRLEAHNSTSTYRFRFTPDRQFIRSSELTGGVLPMPMTNETRQAVTGVTLEGDIVKIALGPGRGVGGMPVRGSVMPIRFIGTNQITVVGEGSPVLTREE